MTIVIPLDPYPKPRPHASRRGGIYMPAAYKQHLDVLQWHLRIGMGTREPVAGPLAVSMRFIRPAKRDRRKDGDFDNYAKHLCDAANKIVWVDDRQIVQATVHIYEAETGRIELSWEELWPETSRPFTTAGTSEPAVMDGAPTPKSAAGSPAS